MRVGVIGTGIGARVVAPAYRLAGAEVELVSARDAAGVAALCRGPADLISVHSPPFLHRQHVLLAAEQPRAVLCDKPFGTSPADARAMVDAVAAGGNLNFVNFEFRCQPAREKMRELLLDGAIGRAEHLAYSSYTSGSRVPLRPYGWLFDASRGGGWIGAFGAHAVDLARWLLGEVVDAGASRWINIEIRPDADGAPRHCDAEDAFTGWIRAASGATATVDSSFTAGVNVPARIVLTGDAGAMENVGDARLSVRRPGVRTEQLEFPPSEGDPHSEAMIRWARRVLGAVAAGEQVGPTFADGLACMQVMETWRGSPVMGASAQP